MERIAKFVTKPSPRYWYFSRKVLKKFILDYGFSIYNIYNKNNVSHKSYNPYSSAIKIEEISMFETTSTGFMKVSF